MVDLNYDPSSLCGPADMRVARFLEEYRGNKLDPSYLSHIQKWHGGIPSKQYFNAQDSKTYRVGRFLTMVDEKSELAPPARPSWEFRDRDIRIDWSVLTLIDEEGPYCQCLFGGAQLLPFANLYWGPHHPDEMGIHELCVNLLAFQYDTQPRPRVVVFLAQEACLEYLRWDRALVASGYSEQEKVRYEDFTVAVAPDFDAFLELLRAEA